VTDDEVLTRFVYSPMFVDKRSGMCKPNLYSHTYSHGFSIQREGITSDTAVRDLVTARTTSRPQDAWFGVVMAKCNEIRREMGGDRTRAFCVYDTGLESNESHAEVFRAHKIAEADDAEHRHTLYKIFGDGPITKSENYRSGRPWSLIPSPVQARTITSKIPRP
jgi:hypothetical protein